MRTARERPRGALMIRSGAQEAPSLAPWSSVRLLAPTLLAVAAVGAGVFSSRYAVQLLAAEVAVFMLVGALIRPDLASLLLVLWLPFETWAARFMPDGYLLLVLPELLAVSILIAVVAREPYGTARWPRGALLAVLLPTALLAVGGVLASLFNATPWIDALYSARVAFRFIPLALVAASLPWGSSVVRRLPTVALLVLAVESAIGLAEYVGGKSVAALFWPGNFTLGPIRTQADTLASVGDRLVAGTTGHYNIYGLLLVLCIAVVVSDLVGSGTRSSLRSGLTLAVAALGVVAVLLCGSRQAAICLVFVAAYAAVTLLREGRLARVGTAYVVFGATLLVVAAATATGQLPIMSRVESLAQPNYFETQAAQDRGYAWAVTLPRMLQRSPMFGTGPGSLGGSYSNTLAPPGIAKLDLSPAQALYAADAGWVSAYAQLGLLGLAGYIGLLAICLTLSMRGAVRSVVGMRAWSLSVVLALGMLASSPLSYKPTAVLWWVLFGTVLLRPLTSRELTGPTA